MKRVFGALILENLLRGKSGVVARSAARCSHRCSLNATSEIVCIPNASRD